jgi:hypothetical protein
VLRFGVGGQHVHAVLCCGHTCVRKLRTILAELRAAFALEECGGRSGGSYPPSTVDPYVHSSSDAIANTIQWVCAPATAEHGPHGITNINACEGVVLEMSYICVVLKSALSPYLRPAAADIAHWNCLGPSASADADGRCLCIAVVLSDVDGRWGVGWVCVFLML